MTTPARSAELIECLDAAVKLKTPEAITSRVKDDLTRLIEEQAKSGVFLSVLGFGMGNLKDGTLEKLASIDPTIERYAENWSMGRMACVDRNILRLAAYEMLFIDEIPLKVAINEAVELAKRYGEADSSKFVNGILDRIAKTECKAKT